MPPPKDFFRSPGIRGITAATREPDRRPGRAAEDLTDPRRARSLPLSAPWFPLCGCAPQSRAHCPSASCSFAFVPALADRAAGTDLDLARLGSLCLRKRQSQNAVFVVGRCLISLDRSPERE